MDTAPVVPEIEFEELLKLVLAEDKMGFLAVDVREESELKESGWIPTAIHIPLSEFGNALALPSEEFETKYGRSKPKGPELVMYCRSGRRAVMAHRIWTQQTGHDEARCYKGSFLDWQSKGGPIAK